ncbi:MAG: protein kinase domain-containing protein [Terriglobales bacterium]
MGMFQSGSRLGPYTILGPLGAGGMGEVYRARDGRLGREVAVKALSVGRLEDAGALRRFEQEARTLAALNHPNLLTVHDVGTTAGNALYLVTELLEGASLRERLAQGKLSQRAAVECGLQLARGLAAAHEKGIIHRDLKPENIFCTPDGRIKILDFGLAKLTATAGTEDKTLDASATAAGEVLGTMGYMAPEQVRGQAADARSDIFSLGCVLYEMLCGRRAFCGGSAADVVSAILREEPAELKAGEAPVTPALDRIVRHCLEKEPRQRFQSVSDVALDLADVNTSSAVVAGPLAPGPPRSRRLAPLAVAALLVLAVGLTWWMARRPTGLPSFQRVTYQQGTIAAARFLPDGQGVIGGAAWKNQPFALFTGRLDASGLSPLDADADRLLAVKAGEAAVLQHTQSLSGWAEAGTLATMPLAGGAPRALLDSVQYADYHPRRGDLAITRYHPENQSYSLEYPIGHVLYQAPGWISDPRFSRDGSRIAFLVHPNFGDDLGRVAVTDLAGQVRLLSPQYASTQGVGWSPSGDEIWFSAASSGTLQAVQAVSLSGRVRPLMTAPNLMRVQDVAADGQVLLLCQSTRLSGYVAAAGDSPPRDITVLDWTYGLMLSADGEDILLGDQDAGLLYSTFLRKADGSPPVRLGDGTPVALSPDKKWAVSVVPSTQQLWLLPTGAGGSRQLTHGPITYLPSDGVWLPDGRAVLVTGTANGHKKRVYQVNLQGEAKPLLPEGTLGHVLTPDGGSLLACPEGSTRFAAYPLDGGSPRMLPWLPAGYTPLSFSTDGRSLYASRTQHSMRDEVYRLSVSGSTPQRLVSTAEMGEAGVVLRRVTSISADGSRYTIFVAQDLSALYVAKQVRR